jgi:hypothetical protein
MDHIFEPQTGMSMAFEDMRRENAFESVEYKDKLKGRDITDDGENLLLKRRILEVHSFLSLNTVYKSNSDGKIRIRVL